MEENKEDLIRKWYKDNFPEMSDYEIEVLTLRDLENCLLYED